MDLISLIFAVIFIIYAAIQIIKETINFFEKHFDTILHYIIFVIDLFFKILQEYPKMQYIIYFSLIVFIIKIISNKTLLRKSNYKSLLINIIYFFFFIMILILLIYNKESIIFLQNNLINPLNIFLSKYQYNDLINLNKIISEENLIAFLIVYILVWFNNRLLWILSIFVLQVSLIFYYYNDLMTYLNKFPKEYSNILTGIIQLIIAAPYIFMIWIFRDNDKFNDYMIKHNEINIKKQEIKLREKELLNKDKELELRERELKLIEKQNKNNTE